MSFLEKVQKFDFKAMSIGYAFFIFANYLFDYILYPFVIFKTGLIYGGIIMTVLAILMCFLTLIVYDRIKRDWLGIEAIKEIENEIENKANTKIGKFISWFLRKGRWAEFIFLSLQFDAFVTTVYLRKGHRLYNGFKKSDWQVFWGSLLLSNVFWILLSFVGVEIFLKFSNWK
jgi:hypothetical protein